MKPPSKRKAFALVLVMITIVLAATMAVFFLSSAGRERRGVDLYARGSHVRHLAGMSVNKVMGQINAATKAGTADVPVSWASQPGMIRTYAGDGTAGNFYKLYSWDNLIEAGVGFDPVAAAQIPPAGWKGNVTLFTDLNQPINDVYPIVDPRAAGVVEGFSIDAANAAVSGSGSEAPMPVKWLYVLEDGRMVAPSGGTGTTATFTGSNAPSAANPIVGRVAFWTDDETSKVNINTASEGAFWDWPKAATYNEMQFAGNPPVGGEFNRVPGHPAMTSLSAVFPELDPGDRWGNVTDYRTKTKSLINLTPRVPYAEASSRGGTYPIETANFDYGPTGSLSAIPGASLLLKSDRLYVSPDEFYFSFSATSRTAPSSPAVTVDMVRQRGFFLTSNSRAPETTLFETPRVSLWPVTWPYRSAHAILANRQTASTPALGAEPDSDNVLLKNNPWMRAEERLLAFTSVLNGTRADGGDRYFFQRQNSESPTYDYASIQRNQELLSYLQRLTSLDVPGFGGNIAGKLTASARDSVLANTFNAVRSLVNQYTLQDDGKLMYSYAPVSFARFLMTNNLVKSNYSEAGAFSPFPLKINLGSGDVSTISEFPKLREAALVFYATDRVLPSKKPDSTLNFNDPLSWNNLINVSGAAGYPVGSQTTKMRAVLLLDFFSLRGASRNNQPVFWIKLSGANMTANGTSLGFGSAVAKMDFRVAGTGGRKMPSYMLPFYQKDATGAISAVKTLSNGNVSDTNYGLISNEINVGTGTALEFSFNGGPMTVEIYGITNGDPSLDPTSDPALKVASYSVDFSSWDGNHKIPLAPRWNYFDKLNSKRTDVSDPKTSECPNPNFKPVPDDLVNRRWSVLEIAPAYRSSDAVSDPATGGSASIPGFTSLYSTGTNGIIVYPPTTGATSFIYRTPPTYALRDATGFLMTDYQKRLSFYPNIKSGSTDISVYTTAEHSALPLNAAGSGSPGNMFNPGGFPAITVYDTVFSVTPDPTGSGNADPRLAGGFQFKSVKDILGTTVPRKQVLTAEYLNPTQQFHTLGAANNFPSGTGYIGSQAYSLLAKSLAPNGMAMVGNTTSDGRLGWGGSAVTIADGESVGVASMYPVSAIATNTSVGDWSSGAGFNMDGGLLPRPDQDFQSLVTPGGGGLSYVIPYFPMVDSATDGLNTPATKGYFSPNRQIPSPITLLGSLPSSKTQGWQSLLFSPNPAVGSSHPGLSGLPEHVLLDLFWMPVAEPYPISEEFSTAGKININYKIMPFSYINRRTGLHALMKSTWLTALGSSLSRDYKSHDFVKGASGSQTRYAINAAETINRFDSDVFDSGNIFRSASQICSMWLVPQGSTAGTVQSFWNGKLLTSDTAREQPYDHLYSRVTTKSNTFTVHWRVQSLRKVPGTGHGTWDESKDRVASELRGSTLIERFIDSNATNIPDYATDAAALPLSNFYKWRVVSESFFQP